MLVKRRKRFSLSRSAISKLYQQAVLGVRDFELTLQIIDFIIRGHGVAVIKSPELFVRHQNVGNQLLRQECMERFSKFLGNNVITAVGCAEFLNEFLMFYLVMLGFCVLALGNYLFFF